MKSAKSLTKQLLTATCIIALAAGCASFSDAGMTSSEAQPDIEQLVSPTSDQGFSDNGDSMDPIRDRPILD